MKKPKKIAIIGGAGRSGADTIYVMAEKHVLSNHDELVIADLGNRAKGMIGEAKSSFDEHGRHPKITTINVDNDHEFEKITGSDVIVFCASAPFPKGGMKNRDWAMYANSDLVSIYAQIVKKYAPEAKVVIDTNPVDVLTTQFFIESGVKASQIVGKGGDLDTQRLHSMLARQITKKIIPTDSVKFGKIERNIYQKLKSSSVSMVGVHTIFNMVEAIPKKMTIYGKKIIGEWFTKDELNQIVENVRIVGPKSSNYLGNTFPSKNSAIMNVRIIQKFLSPKPIRSYVSVPILGKYGIGENTYSSHYLDNKIFAGTLSYISKNGVESIKEIPSIANSPEHLKQYQDGVKLAQQKLRKIEIYKELKLKVNELGSIKINALDDTQLAFSFAENTLIEEVDKFLLNLGKLVQKPGDWKVAHSEQNNIVVSYSDLDELTSLASLLKIENHAKYANDNSWAKRVSGGSGAKQQVVCK